MKFLLFADLHRSKGTFDGGSYEDLAFFEARAKAEGCEFILHAGDMCHGTTHKDNYAFVQAYNALSVPTYHCLGNHDADHTSFEQLAADYRLGKGYYCIDGAHARLIVLNPNYYYENGQYVNYSEGNYFYKDTNYLPPDQLSWLEKTVEERQASACSQVSPPKRSERSEKSNCLPSGPLASSAPTAEADATMRGGSLNKMTLFFMYQPPNKVKR